MGVPEQVTKKMEGGHTEISGGLRCGVIMRSGL